MNIQFKQILKAFTLLLIISFTSCEKDLYEDNIKISSKNIKVSHISLNDLDKTTSAKITEKISLIKKMNKKDSTIENRFEYDSSLEMYIDTENGKLIDNNGELSYTFPMFRTSEENLENIIFKPISSGEIETYVSKYNVKPEEFVDLTYQEISTLEPELQKMSASGWYIICVVSQTQTGVTPIDNGDLTGNFGYEPVWETTGTSCYFIDNSGSSPNYSPIVIPNNPSSNGGGGATGSTGVSTTPTAISPADLSFKIFFKSLTDDQEAWYVENPNAHESIQEYVEENNYSAESEYFVTGMIETCIENGGTFVIDENVTEDNAQVFDNVNEFQNYLNSNTPLAEVESFEAPSNQNGHKAYFRFKLTSLSGVTLIGNVIDTNGTSTISSVTSVENGIYVMSEWSQSGDPSISTLSNGNIKIVVVGSIKSNAVIDFIGLSYSTTYELTAIYNPSNGLLVSSSCIKI